MPGIGDASSYTFVVTYKSSVKSRRQQYKKNLNEVHCRWGYSDLTLERTVAVKLKNGTERVVGTARFVKNIPSQFGSDSTKEKCGLILANSIGPAADVMNSSETWQTVMQQDQNEVRHLASIAVES